MIPLKTRKCKKADYNFYYLLTKKTLWPLIAEYKTIDKKKFDKNFEDNYHNFPDNLIHYLHSTGHNTRVDCTQ